MKLEIVRPKESPFPHSSTYEKIARGEWVQPIKFGIRTSGWFRHEQDALLEAYASGLGVEHVKAVVSQLEAARKIKGAA